MYPISLPMLFMTPVRHHTQMAYGLATTGFTVAAITFITGVIGNMHAPVIPMLKVAGTKARKDMPGIGDVGNKINVQI